VKDIEIAPQEVHFNAWSLDKSCHVHIGIKMINCKPRQNNYLPGELSARQLFVKLALVLAILLATMAVARASDSPIKIVVFGDSLTAGLGLSPEEAFPEQLQKALALRGHKIAVQNAGVSGDTTSAGLARLDWSIAAGTDGVILELGANDALRGIPPDIVRTNLKKMISRLKQRNIDVLLVGMLAPPNMGTDYQTEFDMIYRQLAKSEKIALYPFFLEGVAGVPGLNQADGMHPTAQGIAKIVERFLPVVEKFLTTRPPNQ